MATQYTSILKLALPVQGELSGTWGDVVNDNITSMVEEAIAGRKVINTWTGNSHTLTTADGVTSESRAAILTLTDTGTALTGAGTVVCPAASKVYIVENGTGQTITVKTSSGTGIAVPNTKNMVVFCDGTNVEEGITNINSLALNGDGATVSSIKDEDNMASNSATALATQQSIKAYVDSQVGTVDTLAEVLANGNTTGGTDVAVGTGDDITFADSSKAIFGAGSDLEIYHNGSNSYIDDAGTGSLVIRSNAVNIGKYTGETAAVFTADGSVQLRYDNSAKFETTNTGIDVTGDVVSDGLTVDGTASVSTANPKIRLFETDTTDLNTQLQNQSGEFKVSRLDDDAGSLTVHFKIDHSTGNVSIPSGNVGIGTTSPAQTLHLKSADPVIRLEDSSPDGVYAQIDGAGGGLILSADGGNGSASSFIGFRVDGTASGSERMRIDSSGNVGIGVVPESYQELYRALQVGNTALIGRHSGGTSEMYLTANSYYDGAWKYIVSDEASVISQSAGVISFLNAASGTADATISWSEAMRIDSSGNVGIGTSSPTDTLSVGTLGSGSNSIITIGASTTGTSSIYFGDGASAARFRGYFDYVHSSDSLAIGTAGAERMLIDSSGNVDIGGHVTAGDSSTAAEVIAHYSDGSRTRLQGFGLTFERSSSYVRPSADGTKTLYIGGSDATLDWNQIHFRSLNGLYMTGTRFLTSGRALQNITSIAVDGNVKLDGNYPVGTDNVALGDTALDSSTGTALRNIAIGSKALTGVTTQDDNIGIGYQACLSSGTNDNIAIGNYALDGTDSGTGRNIAIGHFSMSANLASGCFANTCLGYKTGISISSGNDNTLLGYEAGKSLTTGSDNVAIGKSTLDNINTESFNTAVGAFALGSASASVSSTAVGQSAGVLITTGSKNTLIGRFSGNQDGLDIRTLSNRIVLSDGDGNVGLYIDNSQDAHFDGNVIAYSTTISDRRLKSDITNISNALDKVGQINGVTFVRNQNGEKAAGIVAQEIMEVLPEAVKSQALPLQTGEQDKEYYVVEYDAVTGLLVEAVKELKARVEALESK